MTGKPEVREKEPNSKPQELTPVSWTENMALWRRIDVASARQRLTYDSYLEDEGKTKPGITCCRETLTEARYKLAAFKAGRSQIEFESYGHDGVGQGSNTSSSPDGTISSGRVAQELELTNIVLCLEENVPDVCGAWLTSSRQGASRKLQHRYER